MQWQEKLIRNFHRDIITLIFFFQINFFREIIFTKIFVKLISRKNKHMFSPHAVFIDLGKGSSSGAKLTFTFGAGTSVTDRLFEIRVTQLYCDNPSRPPEGCLQYFVGTEGRLKSFNWDGGNGHLESQAYTMCIRQEKGFCCNKYSLCSTETFFTLGLHMMTATPGMAQADGLCTQDYVIIEGIIFHKFT